MSYDSNNPVGQPPYGGIPNPQTPPRQPGSPLPSQPPTLSIIYLCALMPIVGWCIGIRKKDENKPSAGSVCLKLATVGFLCGMAGLILSVGLNFIGAIIGIGGALSYAQSQHKKILAGEIVWEG